jgi:hypothetical protein
MVCLAPVTGSSRTLGVGSSLSTQASTAPKAAGAGADVAGMEHGRKLPAFKVNFRPVPNLMVSVGGPLSSQSLMLTKNPLGQDLLSILQLGKLQP